MEIEEYLLDKGIKPHYRGFKQLVCAIELCQKDERYLRGFTTILYPEIAKDLDTTKSRVERDMRFAIKCSGITQKISEFINRALIEIKIKKSKEEGK